MYIVAWTDTLSADHWTTCHDLSDAQRVYREIKDLDNVYTVSLLAVVESTDYSPAVDPTWEEVIKELEELSLHLQVDGAYLQNSILAEPTYRKADGVDEAIKVIRKKISNVEE